MKQAILFVLCILGSTSYAQGVQNSCTTTSPTLPTQCKSYAWTVNDFPEYLDGTHQNFSNLYQNAGVTEITTATEFNNVWMPLTTAAKDANMYRPMGFKYAVIKAYNSEFPCVTATQVVKAPQTGTTGIGSPALIQSYGVEILVYALDDVELCIKDLYGNSFDPRCPPLFEVCGRQRVKHCFIAPSDHNLQFSIYLKVQDSFDYDVPIFYRLRHSGYSFIDSQNTATGSTDMWCMMISGTVDASWPEFLAETPVGYKIKVDMSAANTHSNYIITFTLLALFSMFLF